MIASENAWKMGIPGLSGTGEEMTFEDMLIAIAVGSANDACVAVAEHLEGTHQNFVQRMNEKAKSMGLKNTNFINAYGLTAEGHYSSALDMAIMARYALEVPKMLEYTSIKNTICGRVNSSSLIPTNCYGGSKGLMVLKPGGLTKPSIA